MRKARLMAIGLFAAAMSLAVGCINVRLCNFGDEPAHIFLSTQEGLSPENLLQPGECRDLVIFAESLFQEQFENAEVWEEEEPLVGEPELEKRAECTRAVRLGDALVVTWDGETLDCSVE